MADTTQTPIANARDETREEKTDKAMDVFLKKCGANGTPQDHQETRPQVCAYILKRFQTPGNSTVKQVCPSADVAAM
jgi:hypothetical protein